MVSRRTLAASGLFVVVFLFLALTQPWRRCGQFDEAWWTRVGLSAIAGTATAMGLAYVGGFPLRAIRAGGFRHGDAGLFFGGIAGLLALLVFFAVLFVAMGLPGVECAPSSPAGGTG